MNGRSQPGIRSQLLERARRISLRAAAAPGTLGTVGHLLPEDAGRPEDQDEHEQREGDTSFHWFGRFTPGISLSSSRPTVSVSPRK